MSDKEQQKYMNPISLEAEMFAKSLTQLSPTHNYIDENVVSALESVMKAIGTFLENNPKEIVNTGMSELEEFKNSNLNHLKSSYYCTRCKKDLGESPEAVTKHVIDKCGIADTITENSEKDLQEKRMQAVRPFTLNSRRNDKPEIKFRPRANASIPIFTSDTKSILSMIKVCNPDLSTQNWKIAQLSAFENGRRQAVFLLDAESLPHLIESRGVVRFGFFHIKLNIYKSDLKHFKDIHQSVTGLHTDTA